MGKRAGGRVVDIIGFRTLTSGVSGGISWQGTLAGLLGAFLIALAASQMGFGSFWITGIGGFAGMLADSLMGSR